MIKVACPYSFSYSFKPVVSSGGAIWIDEEGRANANKSTILASGNEFVFVVNKSYNQNQSIKNSLVKQHTKGHKKPNLH